MNADSPNPETPHEPIPPGPLLPPAPQAEWRLEGHASLIAAVRRRQRKVLWTTGILWGGVAAIVLVIAGALIANRLPTFGRLLVFGAPVALAAIACAFGVWRALLLVGDEARTARLIGQRVPHLSMDVLGALELQRELARGGPDSKNFSPVLARAYLEEIAARARSVPSTAVVDPTPLRRSAAALAGATLAALLVFVLAGAPFAAGWKRAFATEGDADALVQREPITGDVELVYVYPAYTGLPERTVTGTNGEISAPIGTEVRLSTRSDRPVDRAELKVNGKALALKVDGERDLQGRFTVDAPGSYHVVFRTSSGREVARGPDVPITAIADAPPQVTLRSPEEEKEIDPGDKVVLRFEVGDDYGLSGLALVFRPPGKSEEVRVELPRDDERQQQRSYSWDLSALQLRAGDRVPYYVEARDNDAVAGPKPGVSRTQTIKVYSPAEHRRLAMQKAEALWERLVTQLADRLEGPDRAEKSPAAAVIAQSRIDEQGRLLADELWATAVELSEMRDAPVELAAALRTIGEGVRSRVRVTTEFRRLFTRASERGAAGVEAQRRLARVVEEEIRELEKDVLYLEALLDKQKLEDLRRMAEELAQDRRELASLIEQYKATQDEQIKEQVLQEISELRQRIDELMARMSELARGIRDEHLNAEALQELMEEKNLSSALDEIERLMREGKADEALAKLQELSMQMEEMVSQLGEADDNFGQEVDPALVEKYEEFMSDLQSTRAEQEKLAEETKKIRDRTRQQAQSRVEQRGKAMREQLKKEIASLQKEYDELQLDSMSSRAQEPLSSVKDELEHAKNALEANDFDLASEAASRAQHSAEQLAAHGEQQRHLEQMFQNPQDSQQQAQQLAQRLQKDADRVADVNQKLQSLFPPPGQGMSPEDRAQLDKLGQQQRQMQQRAEGLQEKMSELQQMAPVFDEEASRQLGEVGDRMGEAAQRMGGKDAQRGYGEQRAALDQLQKFEQQMQQQKGGGGKGKGLPLPMLGGGRRSGPGRDQEKVEIPDEEQFQAPREFRKDLLDAMKQGAPDKYRDQVKRYYEELVK